MNFPSRGERGLTSDGVVLLLIGTAIVAVCGWLTWSYGASTETEARDFANETLRRLTVAHDANYLIRNLSPTMRARFGPLRQQYAISSLTNLGVPNPPGRFEGTLSRGSEPGKQDPEGHFHAHLLYPTAQAELYLEIARRNGRWQIDDLTFYWNNIPPPPAAAAPSP